MELIIIQKKIFEIRGHRVMFDFHLAQMYGVETRVLKQSVKRNSKRFPPDFMFQIAENEADQMVSQNVIPSKSYLGGVLPLAFTEHGITMLSSILRSDTAINVNIAIVRAFIMLKQYTNNYSLLQKRINELESKFSRKIDTINDVIEFLLSKPESEPKKEKPRRRIGFKTQRSE